MTVGKLIEELMQYDLMAKVSIECGLSIHSHGFRKEGNDQEQFFYIEPKMVTASNVEGVVSLVAS